MRFFNRLGRALLLTATVAVWAVFMFGCGDDNGANSGNNTGGNTCTGAEKCKKVTIGAQTWMAENLNIGTANSWCYGNSPNNCAKYGRLYTWEAALTVCPTGWHLPTRDEWDALATALGGAGAAGTKLKSKTGWDNNSDGSNGNGTDEYGFSALPGGGRGSDGAFAGIGSYGYWWTATDGGSESGSAYYQYIFSKYDELGNNVRENGFGWSVRCVADGGAVPPTVYTISFNADGGTVSPAAATTGIDGKLASLPAPMRSGYVFDGWFTAVTGGTEVTASTVFNGNATIYARWTIISTYTITFDANGGTVSPVSSTTGADGKLASLPMPTRSDYAFNGWFTAINGGTAVTARTVFSANTTVHAQWVYGVTIGGMVWMAKNLNMDTSKKAHNNRIYYIFWSTKLKKLQKKHKNC